MPKSIAILAPSSVPFQVGGAEKFWWGMRDAIARYSGQFVDLIKIPTPEDNFRELVASYRKFAELDLKHFDMVITTKYPAWMIDHPNHVLYMQHPLRGLYDTYHFTGLPPMLDPVPSSLGELAAIIRRPEPTRQDLFTVFDLLEKVSNMKSVPADVFRFPGPLIRELTHFFDRVAKGGKNVKAWLAISATVRGRQDYLPACADVKVLHHPSDLEGYFSRPGEYIFTSSRINATKRVQLLVDAMKYMKADVPFKIAGTGPELEYLRERAAHDPRIEFLGHVSDEDMLEHYARARFVPFVPYDEDYGLVTIEAMKSAKPVLTVNDAGGVCEFVENGVTGLCVEPDPRAIGEAMQYLLDNPEITERMGKAARERVAHINWQENVKALLTHAALANTKKEEGGKPKILVCCHFAASPSGAGGERRLYHFCQALSQKADVALVAMGSPARQGIETVNHSQSFHELILPWPEDARGNAEKLGAECGASMDDIAVMLNCASDAFLMDALKREAADASCVVVSHPYMFPALESLGLEIPLIYDAHNVEADVKAGGVRQARPELIARVAEVEEKCCREAALILACSRENIARFQQLYDIEPERFQLAPNGADIASIIFVSPHEREALRKKLAYPDSRLILFMGTGHEPNIEAAGEIMKLARQIPDVEFLLVGTVSTQARTRKMPRPENAHLVGTVSEDVKNVLLSVADVAVNPMSSGSGTNLKMVEYLAAGLPSVSTPFGMRGMEDFMDGALVGELEDFPSLIRRALDNPPSGASLKRLSARVGESLDWPRALAAGVGKIMSLCRESADNGYAAAN